MADSEFLRMHNELVSRLQVDKTISMYALFATNFHSVNRAMDFIYEKEEDIALGKFVMLHPFVGYEPENNNYDDGDDEIDALEKILTPRKICFICKNNSDCHKEIA